MGMVNEAADVKGPLATTINEGTGVICLAVTTSAKVYVLPDIMRGRMVRVLSVGAATEFLAGDANVSVTVAQNSGEASSPIVITVNAATGDRFPDGVPDHFVISAKATHFCVRGSAACNFYIRPA